MGRVKRYKKIKACDPFAKRPRSEVDTNVNDPPINLDNDFAGRIIEQTV